MQYLQKSMGDEVDFCLQINRKVLYKLIVSFWMCVAQHTQSTQNNKFTLSLQYLKENLKDKVEFLPANKHQRFLQSNTTIFRVFQIALRGGGFPHHWGELKILLGGTFFTGRGICTMNFFLTFWGFCDAQINILYILNIS